MDNDDNMDDDDDDEQGQINGQDDDDSSEEDDQQFNDLSNNSRGHRSSNVMRYSMKLTQMYEKKKKNKR